MAKRALAFALTTNPLTSVELGFCNQQMLGCGPIVFLTDPQNILRAHEEGKQYPKPHGHIDPRS